MVRQRDRFDAYRDALTKLDRLGLLYPAFMSRNEIATATAGASWPRDPEGGPLYPGNERDWPQSRRQTEMESGKPYALRLDMAGTLQGVPALSWTSVDPLGIKPRASHPADPAAWGDVILARKEIPASYHIAVVVDDASQGITDVIRGKDLEAATSVHRLLQTLLGLPEPRYFHHRLILDESGEKLSKSRGSETIRARREAGETPEELIAGLGLGLQFSNP